MADEPRTPAEQVAHLYQEQESQAAKAMEGLVSTGGFAQVLARSAENAAAVTKLGWDAMDLVLRNLRLAGRRNVTRIATQLARTEDKLERVLQEVEDLRDELARRDEDQAQEAKSNGSSTRSQARSKK